jgi:hypothetical protein
MLFPKRVSSRSRSRVRVIKHVSEYWREGMTLTTSYFGFGDIPQGLAAVSAYLNLLFQEWKGAFKLAFED